MCSVGRRFVGLGTMALVGFACAAAAVAGSTASTAGVGYVEALSGCPKAHVLVREGKRIPFAIFAPLQNDDEIYLEKCADPRAQPPEVVIVLGGRRVIINRAGSPYKVKNEHAQPSTVGNVLRWAGDFFVSSLQHEEDDEATEALITRGGRPLELPLLKGTHAKLGGVNESLHLAWRGGTPAYTLTIVRDGIEIVSLRDIATRSAVLPVFPMSVGTYDVRVSDRNNRQAVEHFEVVKREEVPQLPDDVSAALSSASIPDNARQVLAATWLAEQEHGAWSLQAYQRLSGIAAWYAPAAKLQAILEEHSALDRERWRQ